MRVYLARVAMLNITKLKENPISYHIQLAPLEDSLAPSCGSTLLLRNRTDFESKFSDLKRSVRMVW
jgi:hypothetical protein